MSKEKIEKLKTEPPHISVNAQYIKDMSFENPGAPASLSKMDKNPIIDLSLDLSIKKMEEEDYFEVEILVAANAKSEKNTLFILDITYAGVFHLMNVPDDQRELILAIHCPAIIFPYVRKIISDTTQDGGFQPLMIDPIDFGALYAKKMMESKGN